MDGGKWEAQLNARGEGIPHEALVWRAVNGATGCVRTPEAKLDPSEYGSDEFELYDMLNDPCESTNRIGDLPEQRQKLTTLWNEWNAPNEACYLLQAYDYQKERMRLYEDLHKGLKQKVMNLKPKVVK